MKQDHKRGKGVKHNISAESNTRPLVRKASSPIVSLGHTSYRPVTYRWYTVQLVAPHEAMPTLAPLLRHQFYERLRRKASPPPQKRGLIFDADSANI